MSGEAAVMDTAGQMGGGQEAHLDNGTLTIDQADQNALESITNSAGEQRDGFSSGGSQDGGAQGGQAGSNGTQGGQQAGQQGAQPEALDPGLLEAATFAGLSEQDLRDAIKTVGRDKAIASIQTLVQKASARWEPQGQQQTQTQPQQQRAWWEPQQPVQQQQQQGGNGQQSAAQLQGQGGQQGQQGGGADPLDAFLAQDFAANFVKEYPEGKAFVESTQGLAKYAKDLRTNLSQATERMGQLAQFALAMREEQDRAMASDLYDFYAEVEKGGFTGYGKLTGQPTPNDLAARQRVFAAAKAYQASSPVPVRFSTALKHAHAGLNVGSLIKVQQQQGAAATAVQQRSKTRDLAPASGGGGNQGTDMKARDAAALETMKKLGF